MFLLDDSGQEVMPQMRMQMMAVQVLCGQNETSIPVVRLSYVTLYAVGPLGIR